MKRTVSTALCALTFVLCLSDPTLAQGIITFDEHPAVNCEQGSPPCAYLSEEYASQGVHFPPQLYGSALQDGTTYSGGTWGVTGTNGPQFLGCNGEYNPQTGQRSSGLVVEFDKDIRQFTIDFTVGQADVVEPDGLASIAAVAQPLELEVFVFNNSKLIRPLYRRIPFPDVNAWIPIVIGSGDSANPVFFDRVFFYVHTDSANDAFLCFDNLGFADDYPEADFSADPQQGCIGADVCFTNLSVRATSWEWDFGDGDQSDGESPCHTYAEPGLYTITLTATNLVGSDTEIKAEYIVEEPCRDLIADFHAAPTSGPNFLPRGFRLYYHLLLSLKV